MRSGLEIAGLNFFRIRRLEPVGTEEEARSFLV